VTPAAWPAGSAKGSNPILAMLDSDDEDDFLKSLAPPKCVGHRYRGRAVKYASSKVCFLDVLEGKSRRGRQSPTWA